MSRLFLKISPVSRSPTARCARVGLSGPGGGTWSDAVGLNPTARIGRVGSNPTPGTYAASPIPDRRRPPPRPGGLPPPRLPDAGAQPHEFYEAGSPKAD